MLNVEQILGLLLDEESFIEITASNALPSWMPTDHKVFKKAVLYITKVARESTGDKVRLASTLVTDAERGKEGAMTLLDIYRRRLLTVDEFHTYRELAITASSSILTNEQANSLQVLETKSGERFKTALAEFAEDFMQNLGSRFVKGKLSESASPDAIEAPQGRLSPPARSWA